MDFSSYNEIVRFWIEEVMENHQKDAEKTLKYCKDIIDYGLKENDQKVAGFGYYYSAETFYSLNDGEKFFEAISKALSCLDEAEQWDYVATCYNILGIAAVNKGNAPVAMEYYMKGINYARKADYKERRIALYINAGALNLQCERFEDAEELLLLAKDQNDQMEDSPASRNCSIGIDENLIKCYTMQGKFEEAKKVIKRVEREEWKITDNLEKLSLLTAFSIYYFKTNQNDLLEDCIEQIHVGLEEDMILLDMFDDYYDYANMLLESGHQEELWYVIDIIEPIVKSLNIINLHLKIISLKMKSYRINGLNADFLRSAGLYYELSELMERESKEMINSLLTLRRKLEISDQARKKAEEQNEILRKKSQLDALTKIANRFRLNEYSEYIFEEALKKKQAIALEILDIDYFKEFNDNYGHQAGDNCLVEVSRMIKEVAKAHNGFCARYGGDEFVLIYHDVTREEAFSYEKELKEKILGLNLEHKFSKAIPQVTISQGMCWDKPSDENRMWDFLHAADDMLYRVKTQSRNNYALGNLLESGEILIGSREEGK